MNIKENITDIDKLILKVGRMIDQQQKKLNFSNEEKDKMIDRVIKRSLLTVYKRLNYLSKNKIKDKNFSFNTSFDSEFLILVPKKYADIFFSNFEDSVEFRKKLEEKMEKAMTEDLKDFVSFEGFEFKNLKAADENLKNKYLNLTSVINLFAEISVKNTVYFKLDISINNNNVKNFMNAAKIHFEQNKLSKVANNKQQQNIPKIL